MAEGVCWSALPHRLEAEEERQRGREAESEEEGDAELQHSNGRI